MFKKIVQFQITILKIVVIFFVTISSLLTQAQEFSLYSVNDILVETVPEIPGPNEFVDLNLNSYSFNLNNYYIAWFKDGEKQSAGYGNRDFSFQTGESGDITEVIAVIEFENQVFRKELHFAPSTVDLLWEVTDAYTPPFYKGKPLPIKQSQIRVTAISETLLIEPNDAPNLIYYWDNNYQRIVSKSGFGKQSFEFTADPFVEIEKITVTSNDRRENSFAKNTINIPTTTYQPKILFYEINEEGRLLTNKALNTNTVISGDTLRFSFHPLNISSIESNFVDLFVNWSINNDPGPPQDFAKQNELYLTTNGKSGAILINLELEGIEKLLQEASEEMELVFNVN